MLQDTLVTMVMMMPIVTVAMMGRAWTFACMRAVFSPASYLFSQLLLLFEATPGGLSLSVGRCFGRAVEGESLCSNSRA